MRPFFALPILISLFAFGPAAAAFTGLTTENFTTATYEDTANTTAVWNLVLNAVHPPLTVCTTSCATNSEDFDVDIGTGSDGPFDVPYYANFGTITGTPGSYTIVINTNTHPSFNFTYFNLAAGYTIAPVGSGPLWFKVQGNFTNSGTINCSGGNGGDISTNPANGGTGGLGICGGGNGGNGGSSSSPDGSPGGDGGAPACTHGLGGPHSSTAGETPSGGGGGGAFSSGAAGAGSGFIGSAAGGTSTNDTAFADLTPNGDVPGAGSGGGGGGADLVGGFISSGAGGGAGGGVIHIAVGGNFTQNPTGLIWANGGNGGNSNTSVDGGPGGGGGGGTIVIHALGTFTDNGNNSLPGSIMALMGAQGNPSHVDGFASNAGSGSGGREWLINPVGPGLESPASPLGVIHYKVESFVMQTLGYDSLNTSPMFTLFSQIANLPNASTATLQIAGSNDNFVNDNTGFVPFTNVNALSGKRFFRIKDTIQLIPSGQATTPVLVTNLTATYAGFQTSSFQFGSACGTFGSPGEFFFDLFLCLSIGLISTGRLGKRKLFRRSKTNPGS